MDLNGYLLNFSQEQDPVLQWLQKQTNLRTNHARMLCGPVEGKLMEFLSRMLAPANILEIGAFTGYSAICLARGLKEGGMLDSLELNDELEDLILQAHEKAGLSEKITLHIGDAKETLKRLRSEGKMYDLVFIDANKREYTTYYELVFDMVRPGGYILADNVLWDGKVYRENVPQDAQTQGIYNFNRLVKDDPRVENVIIPLRDGMNLIRKKERMNDIPLPAAGNPSTGGYSDTPLHNPQLTGCPSGICRAASVPQTPASFLLKQAQR